MASSACVPARLPAGSWSALATPLPGVKQWAADEDVRLTIALNAAQVDAAVCQGSIGEIGVHHGSYFIVLARLAAATERLWAADVFEGQKLNLDRSGRGDSWRFIRNVALASGRTDVLLEHTASQFAADPPRPFRFISVDGSHMSTAVFVDLEFAVRNLAPGGIVSLDDIPHQRWVGVARGLRSYWHLRDPGYKKLRPLVIGRAKLFLSSADAHPMLSRSLLERVPSLRWASMSLVDDRLSSLDPLAHVNRSGAPASVWERLERALVTAELPFRSPPTADFEVLVIPSFPENSAHNGISGPFTLSTLARAKAKGKGKGKGKGSRIRNGTAPAQARRLGLDNHTFS